MSPAGVVLALGTAGLMLLTVFVMGLRDRRQRRRAEEERRRGR